MTSVQTFCFVLLNEEIALLKLVTLKSEESRPNSVAVILASNSSGSGRHLDDEQVPCELVPTSPHWWPTLCLRHVGR